MNEEKESSNFTHDRVLKDVSNDLEHNWLQNRGDTRHRLHHIQHCLNCVKKSHGNHGLLIRTTISVQHLDQCCCLETQLY
jgi:hypothetical protein